MWYIHFCIIHIWFFGYFGARENNTSGGKVGGRGRWRNYDIRPPWPDSYSFKTCPMSCHNFFHLPLLIFPPLPFIFLLLPISLLAACLLESMSPVLSLLGQMIIFLMSAGTSVGTSMITSGGKSWKIFTTFTSQLSNMQRCQPMSWTCWGQSFCVCWLYTDWHVACRASWTSDRREAKVKCDFFLLLCKKTIHLSKESGSKKGHFTNHMRKCFVGLFFKVGLFPFKYFQTKAKMLFKANFISQWIQLNAGNNIV